MSDGISQMSCNVVALESGTYSLAIALGAIVFDITENLYSVSIENWE